MNKIKVYVFSIAVTLLLIVYGFFLLTVDNKLQVKNNKDDFYLWLMMIIAPLFGYFIDFSGFKISFIVIIACFFIPALLFIYPMFLIQENNHQLNCFLRIGQYFLYSGYQMYYVYSIVTIIKKNKRGIFFLAFTNSIYYSYKYFLQIYSQQVKDTKSNNKQIIFWTALAVAIVSTLIIVLLQDQYQGQFEQQRNYFITIKQYTYIIRAITIEYLFCLVSLITLILTQNFFTYLPSSKQSNKICLIAYLLSILWSLFPLFRKYISIIFYLLVSVMLELTGYALLIVSEDNQVLHIVSATVIICGYTLALFTLFDILVRSTSDKTQGSGTGLLFSILHMFLYVNLSMEYLLLLKYFNICILLFFIFYDNNKKMLLNTY